MISLQKVTRIPPKETSVRLESCDKMLKEPTNIYKLSLCIFPNIKIDALDCYWLGFSNSDFFSGSVYAIGEELNLLIF